MAAEDILLEGSHGDTAMWLSNRGEVALDVSLGDTAVEYLLGEVAAVLSFGAGSDVRRGVMCVMVSFCSNGLVTVQTRRWTEQGTSEATEDCGHFDTDEGLKLCVTATNRTFLIHAFGFIRSVG